jgi:hypothetical protein
MDVGNTMGQRHLGMTAAIAVGCLLTAATAGVSAATAKTSGTIHACAKKSTGALRIAHRCASTEKAVSWGKVGPRGRTGASGRRGAAAPAAVRIFYSGPATGVDVFTTSFGDWRVTVDCVNDAVSQTIALTVDVQQTSDLAEGGGFESSGIQTLDDAASTSVYSHGGLSSDAQTVGGTSAADADNGSRVVGTVVLATASGTSIGQITYSARILTLATNECKVVGLATASP